MRIERALICAVLVLGAGDRAALGQICTGSDGTHPRVTQDYVPSATGGYVRETNSSSGPPATGSTFAFRDVANNQDILMADPTVLEIDGVYYISGTTDGWAVPGSTLCTQRNYDPAHSNFAIYKTTDFRTFTFHAWAFSSTDWLPHQRIRTLNGRNFARLQSPQLFRKPYDLSNVYMVFHATEEALVPEPNADGSLNWTTWQDPNTWPLNPWNHAEVLAHPDRLVNTLWPDAAILGRYYDSNAPDKLTNPAYWAPEACDYGNPAKQAKIDKFNLMSARADAYGSVFIVSVPTATFKGLSGVAFPGANPSWFGYRQGNGAGPLRYDGGVLQGNKIPIGGAASIANPNAFASTGVTYAKQLYRCGNVNTSLGMAYWSWGNLPWMFNDGFVFFEPGTNQAYLYYGWADFLCSPTSEWSGNHIAYHKLRNTPGMFELDATAPSRALAFDRNTGNPITPTNPACPSGVGVAQPNGVIDKIGCPQPFGSAEGLAVFHWAAADGGPNKYFAVYTRNMWDSPAYQVVYRVADSLDGLGLGVNFFTSPNVPAALAIQEHVLLVSDAPTSPDGSSYGHVDVFRVNWPQPTGPAHRRPYLAFHAKKAGNQDRHIFFKELRWNPSTGKLDQIYPAAGGGRPAWSLATQFLLPRC